MENKKYLVNPIAGDTDSIMSSDTVIIKSNDKIKKMTIEEWYNENLNGVVEMTSYGHEMITTKDKILNWDNQLKFCNVRRIIRHKVTKDKWVLKTKSGKMITVTADHSLIVFRDGKKIEVKPQDVKLTDKVLIINKKNEQK